MDRIRVDQYRVKVAESCEYGNEPSYSTNGWKFVEYIGEYKSRSISWYVGLLVFLKNYIFRLLSECGCTGTHWKKLRFLEVYRWSFEHKVWGLGINRIYNLTPESLIITVDLLCTISNSVIAVQITPTFLTTISVTGYTKLPGPSNLLTDVFYVLCFLPISLNFFRTFTLFLN